MKIFAISALAILMAGLSPSARATPVQALSFLQMESDFLIVGNLPFAGQSPDGVTNSVGGPDFSISINSQINAPDAVTAIDETSTQVGCAGCEPPIPFVSNRQLRTNRSDPTEFADAQWNVESSILQDQGADVTAFAIGRQTIDRDGLAQLRIASSPAPAEAESTFGISRVTTLENTAGEDVVVPIRAEVGGDLLSRYSGDDGLARTSATQSILFSGVSDGNLTTVTTAASDNTTETGDGATVTSGIFDSGDGITGFLFTASATAIGDGGFNEAAFSFFHQVIFLLTIEAGQSIEVETAFSQANYVEFAPTPVSTVPLPAGAFLLLSGIALLAGRKFVVGKRS
ncbi:MAG: hypothetical protein AAFY05_11010 [Pseudomonadota bacterium]